MIIEMVEMKSTKQKQNEIQKIDEKNKMEWLRFIC